LVWDFQDGELLRRDQRFDAARQAGLAPDEARAFEAEYHLVDGKRGHPEVPLHLPFGRWPAVHARVASMKVTYWPCLGVKAFAE
jgi:hypothetical protein